MEALLKTNIIALKAEEKVQNIKSTTIDGLFESMERNRFGVTPVILVIVACLGAIACAVAVQYSILMLGLVVFSTGMVEAMLIAIAPMRVTAWFVAVALLIDLFVFFS